MVTSRSTASPSTQPGVVALRWPWPALLAWLGAAASAALLVAAGLPAAVAECVAASAVGVAAWQVRSIGSGWRRVLVAAGYPLALVVSDTASSPPGVWLLALVALALVYPVRLWRDAPWFPTPRRALEGLASRVSLTADARILDAGCGSGHGLDALRREWPRAALEGIEWSWPLVFVARRRCRFARVHRGDMWAADWSPYALVYLFQRPETMSRAIDKAERELRRGAWIASLDFAVPGRHADAVLRNDGAPAVWLYRVRGGAAQSPSGLADIPA